jgi:hypothetical protein
LFLCFKRRQFNSLLVLSVNPVFAVLFFLTIFADLSELGVLVFFSIPHITVIALVAAISFIAFSLLLQVVSIYLFFSLLFADVLALLSVITYFTAYMDLKPRFGHGLSEKIPPLYSLYLLLPIF